MSHLSSGAVDPEKARHAFRAIGGNGPGTPLSLAMKSERRFQTERRDFFRDTDKAKRFRAWSRSSSEVKDHPAASPRTRYSPTASRAIFEMLERISFLEPRSSTREENIIRNEVRWRARHAAKLRYCPKTCTTTQSYSLGACRNHRSNWSNTIAGQPRQAHAQQNRHRRSTVQKDRPGNDVDLVAAAA